MDFKEMTLDQVKRLLRVHGRTGYKNIVRFSQIFLYEGELIIDCPTRDDAEALVWDFGMDLNLIVKYFRIARSIEIRVSGETVYSPYSPDFIFK